ncbi:IS66 family insertion sequence element accessory protein TnpB [Segatella copri]|uniref:IS66 family insertion sequence element accessory protein TnpB n=1 Tax=Segatella copri TaxID=165179 RepID=A0AAW5TVV4_9BACT|nr:IS66 family insertion sequence element accessory protein TnpB [Segatella copri]MCW4092616.1 IS66 family insertion sequence element accessory protein TnpB [Segatella copri]
MHLMKLYEKEGLAMFGLNENTQYYVCQRYVRMNMGINGLYQIVRTEMELPPLGGAVFIFFSKNRQQVKMLKWDGDGFLLYQKRLERGTFELPFFDPQQTMQNAVQDAICIMSGICLKSMRYRKRLNL